MKNERICIVTDDNAGFSEEEAKQLGLRIVKMPIIIDGVSYFQNENITTDKFYKAMEDDKDITTSQPSPGMIIKMWDDILKEYDSILHIPMTSGLSEECNTAKMLAKEYGDKVQVVDNHRISVTLKSAVYDAIKLSKTNKSAKEIKEILETLVFESSIYIMVDTLKYLKKGGRITPAGALLGATLHIKPVLSIFGEKLDAYKKAIGTKKAKQIMIDAIKNDLNVKFKDSKIEDLTFGMAYSHNLDDANAFKKEVSKEFNIKEEDIIMDELSLSVATHIGPGSLALTITKK